MWNVGLSQGAFILTYHIMYNICDTQSGSMYVLTVCALYVFLLLLILSTQQTKIVYLLLWLWDGAHGLQATYTHTRQQHTYKQPEHDADKRPPRHTTCTYTYVVCTGIMPLVKLGHRWRIAPMESPGHVYRQLTNVSTGVCLCLYS